MTSHKKSESKKNEKLDLSKMEWSIREKRKGTRDKKIANGVGVSAR